jgi:ATP-dependent Clp protease ATP-binding subunit ClpA
MFERFTERSRRVVVLAQEESRMLDHNYIGTEHLLLGLIHEGDGIAAQVIELTGLTLDTARAEVEAIIGRGASAPSGHIPFTARAKTVLELALREALALKKSYIGPEHILLGLIREKDGVGAQILERLGAPLPVLRAQVIELAAGEATEPGQDESLGAEWLAALSQGAGAGFRRRARAVAEVTAVAAAQAEQAAQSMEVVRSLIVSEFRETLASLGETLAALDLRMGAIERQLGIAAAAPEDSAAPSAQSAAPRDSAAPSAAPEEETPGDEAPAESVELGPSRKRNCWLTG